jgi:large subunit ribosomal protein L10
MAVSRADKAAEIGQLEAAFGGAETAVLVEYKGITVPQVTELRRQIRAVGGTYRVVKNTLARRAVAGTPFESFREQFTGSTAVVYTATDPVAMAKALTNFAKTAPVLTIKGAVVQGRVATAAAVGDLANLPSKGELYAKLLYVLQAPAQQLVTVLSAIPRDFVTVLAEAEKKRAAADG